MLRIGRRADHRLIAGGDRREAGKWCNLVIWDIDQPGELVYRIGFNPLHRRIWRGQ